MPTHDWTRVIAGTFHHLHCSWITILARELNNGLLPTDHYALAEQVARDVGPDVLTLHSATDQPPGQRYSGMTAVAEAPPKVSITESLEEVDFYALKRKSLLIRHTAGVRSRHEIHSSRCVPALHIRNDSQAPPAGLRSLVCPAMN